MTPSELACMFIRKGLQDEKDFYSRITLMGTKQNY